MTTWLLGHIDPGAAALATTVSLTGLATLYAAWRRRQRHVGLVALGWGLIALSYMYWGQAAGPDSGSAHGTVVLMLAAIVLVMSNGQWRPKQAVRMKRKRDSETDAREDASPREERGVVRAILRFVAAGPLALGTALAASMLIVASSPWIAADRLVTAACSVLLLWTAAMIWSCCARRLVLPIVAMIAVSFISLSLLPALSS